jgi:flagellar hook assembly protein FlgD
LRFVTLKIFDILGKEIETLVNEQKSPGVYEVTFDGTSLPSGTYLYKIIVSDPAEQKDEFTVTKKMLLLK